MGWGRGSTGRLPSLELRATPKSDFRVVESRSAACVMWSTVWFPCRGTPFCCLCYVKHCLIPVSGNPLLLPVLCEALFDSRIREPPSAACVMWSTVWFPCWGIPFCCLCYVKHCLIPVLGNPLLLPVLCEALFDSRVGEPPSAACVMWSTVWFPCRGIPFCCLCYVKHCLIPVSGNPFCCLCYVKHCLIPVSGNPLLLPVLCEALFDSRVVESPSAACVMWSTVWSPCRGTPSVACVMWSTVWFPCRGTPFCCLCYVKHCLIPVLWNPLLLPALCEALFDSRIREPPSVACVMWSTVWFPCRGIPFCCLCYVKHCLIPVSGNPLLLPVLCEALFDSRVGESPSAACVMWSTVWFPCRGIPFCCLCYVKHCLIPVSGNPLLLPVLCEALFDSRVVEPPSAACVMWSTVWFPCRGTPFCCLCYVKHCLIPVSGNPFCCLCYVKHCLIPVSGNPLLLPVLCEALFDSRVGEPPSVACVMWSTVWFPC